MFSGIMSTPTTRSPSISSNGSDGSTIPRFGRPLGVEDRGEVVKKGRLRMKDRQTYREARGIKISRVLGSVSREGRALDRDCHPTPHPKRTDS